MREEKERRGGERRRKDGREEVERKGKERGKKKEERRGKRNEGREKRKEGRRLKNYEVLWENICLPTVHLYINCLWCSFLSCATVNCDVELC